MIDIKSGIGGAAAALLLAAGLFIAGDASDVEEHIAPSETPNPSVLGGSCPSGWEYEEILDHQVAQTCTWSGITMTMYPYLKVGQTSLDTRNPLATPVACLQTPNWPRSWCLE